ncbi:hypothetical protein F5Y07DRAFT_393048 [Xylaria sp. FL0933]|nr:hypothetical protein F5Y07DRAFT_393048 [Xylaria sp. FL0933]
MKPSGENSGSSPSSRGIPSLHIVQLGSKETINLISCGQLTTKARRIPSVRFAPTGSPIASDITPTLPEPITSLNIIDNHPEEFRFTNSSRPSTASPEQKRNALFNIKWPGLKAKSNRNKGQPRSTYAQESNDAGLPKFMSFTFALTGRALLVWKKDGDILVRIELEASVLRSVDLGALLPGGTDIDRSASIRFARLSLFVVHCSGLPERSSVYPLDDHTEPRCLAISANNAFVAVGFGTNVLLLYYQGAEQRWLRVLRIPELTNPSMARFQMMNFSGDSSCLVVSTQKRDAMRSEDDDVVFTHVWQCAPSSHSPLTLWPCRMPTVRLTTINFHPVLATGLITGLTTTHYPLFLVVPNFRIRCSMAHAPPSGHQIYLLDQRSRVLCADLQAQSVHVIADLNALHGALKPQEEQAIIGVSMAGRLKVFWRQGNELHIVEIETRERMGVGLYYNKEDISWRWFDALGVS